MYERCITVSIEPWSVIRCRRTAWILLRVLPTVAVTDAHACVSEALIPSSCRRRVYNGKYLDLKSHSLTVPSTLAMINEVRAFIMSDLPGRQQFSIALLLERDTIDPGMMSFPRSNTCFRRAQTSIVYANRSICKAGTYEIQCCLIA